MTHLHWLYTKGPKALEGVSKAMTFCGKGPLPAGEVTADIAAVTCQRCLAAVRVNIAETLTLGLRTK